MEYILLLNGFILMLDGIDLDELAIKKLKEIGSQLKVDNIYFPDNVEHKRVEHQRDEKKDWAHTRFPISIKLDNQYPMDSEKLNERVLKLIDIHSDFIKDDINHLIQHNNCKEIAFRGFYIQCYKDFPTTSYNIELTARISVYIDKELIIQRIAYIDLDDRDY